jgi:hypothetical protein
VQSPELVIESTGVLGGDVWSLETARDELSFWKLAKLDTIFRWGENGGGDCRAPRLLTYCKQRAFTSEVK